MGSEKWTQYLLVREHIPLKMHVMPCSDACSYTDMCFITSFSRYYNTKNWCKKTGRWPMVDFAYKWNIRQLNSEDEGGE